LIDLSQVSLEVDGEVKLHFAQAYGFRNIQGIIGKMKRSKCPYHFVEVSSCLGIRSGHHGGGGGSARVMSCVIHSFVYLTLQVMACPSGCLGGGGLPRDSTESKDTTKERIVAVSRVYHDRSRRDPRDNPLLVQLYR